LHPFIVARLAKLQQNPEMPVLKTLSLAASSGAVLKK
jgi:hypothetical protein